MLFLKHINKKKRIIIWSVFIVVLVIYIFVIIDRNVRPTVLAVSEVQARVIATQIINDAVKENINDDIRYQDLIYIQYDNSGRVTLMQANTILMNDIASDVASEVQAKMRKISMSTIKIPLGNVMDSNIIKGPKINIKIVPQGSVSVDFATEFEESGINQTRHMIYLIITSDVRIIAPLASDTVRVSVNIPIAETVIVGEVPKSFLKLPKNDILDIKE